MSFMSPAVGSRLVAVGLLACGVAGALSFSAAGRAERVRGGSQSSIHAPTSDRLPTGPRGSRTAGGRGNDPVTAAVGADCVAGPPLSWFGPIRELPACTYGEVCGGGLLRLGVGTGGLFDVNGDGRPESFASQGGLLVSKGEPVPCECWLTVEETFVEGGEVIIERRCIVERQPLAAIALALGLDSAFVEDGLWGWKDLDGDGDADLVVMILGYLPSWEEVGRAYWLENTGFEATQPLTGDLNSDGAVNSADLALLLGGWTGS